MSELLEKKLISAFAAGWTNSASGLLGRDSTLSLLALREVTGDAGAGALAVASRWSAAVIVCLFKEEENEEIDRLVQSLPDGSPKPGARAMINAVLASTASSLSDASS